MKEIQNYITQDELLMFFRMEIEFSQQIKRFWTSSLLEMTMWRLPHVYFNLVSFIKKWKYLRKIVQTAWERENSRPINYCIKVEFKRMGSATEILIGSFFVPWELCLQNFTLRVDFNYIIRKFEKIIRIS